MDIYTSLWNVTDTGTDTSKEYGLLTEHVRLFL